jgi:hypothetical protein
MFYERNICKNLPQNRLKQSFFLSGTIQVTPAVGSSGFDFFLENQYDLCVFGLALKPKTIL